MSNNSKFGMPLQKYNYILLGIGFIVIILGFILMIGGHSTNPNTFNADELFSFRRVTLAPILILAGFIFEIYAIMAKPKDKENIGTPSANEKNKYRKDYK